MLVVFLEISIEKEHVNLLLLSTSVYLLFSLANRNFGSNILTLFKTVNLCTTFSFIAIIVAMECKIKFRFSQSFHTVIPPWVAIIPSTHILWRWTVAAQICLRKRYCLQQLRFSEASNSMNSQFGKSCGGSAELPKIKH